MLARNIAFPAPFANASEPVYSKATNTHGVVVVNANGQNVAFVPNTSLFDAIPETKRLSEMIDTETDTIVNMAQELRPDLIENRIRSRTAAQNAIVAAAKQVWNSGVAYADKTASELATLTAPVTLNPATTSTLQNHFLGLNGTAERLAWIGKLEDWELSAIASLPKSVIGLSPEDYDRFIAQRLMRHHISTEMQRTNAASIFQDPTIANLFPTRKTVSKEKLDVWVEMKKQELKEREKVMVALQAFLESVFRYLQIVYNIHPNTTLDRILGRE
ncbi:hypothetical protein D2T29_22455 [Sinirhodobacter populi]|uniref:Uncharacterized protein n=1 Tax=Paenirhodobacter populi TaxID=2306993 RepID=A0A443JWU6_9RHOB|nr:hypothetical protein [Sinirhodobacter populi]RWR24946.1 hypothetical protein D2T29_22455 [Sinirhodobacter populi]